MTDPCDRVYSRFPFAVLSDLADSVTAARITSEIAGRLPKEDHRLRDAIRQKLMNRIPGFRNPLHAPRHLLARKLTHFAFHVPAASRDLLAFWIEGRDELRRAVDEFLDAARADASIAKLRETPTEEWTTEDVLAAADSYVTVHPGGERREIAIAIALRLWKRKLDGEHETREGQTEDEIDETDKAESVQGVEAEVRDLLDAVEGQLSETLTPLRTPRFVQIVEEMQSLPVEAPEWLEVPAFVAAVLRAAASARQRLDDARARLRERLAGLSTRYETALEYADISLKFLADPIDIDRVSVPDLAGLCDRAEDLLGQLAAALENMPRRHNPMKEWHAAVEGLITQIREVTELLKRSVFVSPSPEPPSEPPQRPDGRTEPPVVSEPASVGGGPLQCVASPSCKRAVDAESIRPPEGLGDVPQDREGEARHVAQTDAGQERSGPAITVPASPGLSDSDGKGGGELVDPLPGPEAMTPDARTPPTVTQLAEPVPSPSLDAARASTEGESPEAWTRLVWALIAEDDLAGAYWLIRALRYRGVDPGIHEDFAKAALGVQFLTSGGTDLGLELMEVVAGTDPSNEAETLLAHGVALRGALAAPAVFARWLAPVSQVRPLQEVLEHVRQFGVPLHPEAFVDLGSAVRREEALRVLADEVRDWLRRAELRTTKAVRATNVWQQLVRRDLADLLKPIIENQQERAAVLRADLERWRDRRNVTDRIHAVDAELGGLRRSPLTGDPRDQIIHRVAEVCALGLRWVDLVDSRRTGSTVQGAERARALRERLARSIPGAERALGGMVDNASSPVAEAARFTIRALAALRRTVNLTGGLAIGPGFDNDLLWKLCGGSSVKAALGARLLWLPEVTFVPDGDAPPDQALPDIARVLRASVGENRDLARAFEGWIRRRDFRFADVIAGVLGSSAGPRISADRVAGEIERAREALSGEVLDTQAAIEQAAVDGLIGEDVRAEYTAAAAVDLGTVLDFDAQSRALTSIRRSLDDVRRQRIREQRADFDRLDGLLATGPQAEIWAERRKFVLTQLEHEHTRVVDECLTAMRQAVEQAAPLPPWSLAVDDAGKALEAYLAVAPVLARLKGLPRQGEWPVELADLAATMAGREKNVERLWDAWLTLKRRGTEAELHRAIDTLMFELGFEILSGIPRVQLVTNVDDYLEARVRMSPRTPPPAPQFGSYVHGPFEVMGVWKQPGTDALRTRLLARGRQQQPLLVLYFSALTSSERRQAARLVPGRPILLLDEPLVLFLAMRGRGLADLFACTLPYTRLVPYTTAGHVPPELFQGREKILEELENPRGSCLLYGGRQLGKSALLHHVAHRLNDPAHGSYAAVEDIQNVGNPLAGLPAANVWDAIRTALQSMALFSERTLASNPDQLVRQIADVLARNPRARVTVGLDEADHFLAADATTEFSELARLRGLMTRTERRFRVILAGARTVQNSGAFRTSPWRTSDPLSPSGLWRAMPRSGSSSFP